jgi:hypothetical protein
MRYHFVNAMLLNEVQRQQRVIETQETEIEVLKQEMAGCCNAWQRWNRKGSSSHARSIETNHQIRSCLLAKE